MSYWDISPKNPKKNYLRVNRWSTYAKIITAVLDIDPFKILDIGIGNRVVYDILKLLDYNVEGLDIDKELNPDYVMDVRSEELLKFKGKFDLVIASQMFEHIPYNDFLRVIKNLSEITKHLIITLPYCCKNDYPFLIKISFPFFNQGLVTRKYGKKFFLKKNPPDHNKIHCWEIGTKGFPLRKIKKDINKSGWIIRDRFFDHDNPYHYFFLLVSKKYYRRK